MSSPDFAHTGSAVENRRRKVTALALAATTLGVAEVGLDVDVRRCVVKATTGVSRAGDETWAMVDAALDARPPMFADPGTRARCGCTANEHGVLIEFPGWPCPHTPGYQAEPPTGPLPPGTALCGPGVPSEQDLATVHRFAAQLAGAGPAPKAPEEEATPAYGGDTGPGQEWWA